MSAALPPAPVSRRALRARMLALRERGASYNMLAAALNREGVPGVMGGRWFSASVRSFLLQRLDQTAPPDESDKEFPCKD